MSEEARHCRVRIDAVARAQPVDASSVHVEQQTISTSAVGKQRVAAKAIGQRRVEEVRIAMPLAIAASVGGRTRNEIDDAAEHVRTVLRTVGSAQNLHCLEAGWFN